MTAPSPGPSNSGDGPSVDPARIALEVQALIQEHTDRRKRLEQLETVAAAALMHRHVVEAVAARTGEVVVRVDRTPEQVKLKFVERPKEDPR